jgi:tetratricopeptide (TPR) repeat protein
MKIFRLLLPALLLTACSTHSAIERSQGYVRRGDFLHAYQVLHDARNEQLAGGSVDEDLEEAYLAMKKEYLRDRARRMIFQEREDLALRDLSELAELDPNFPELETLSDRARHKKAVREVQRGEEQLLRKEYPEALKSFLAARQIKPGLLAAEEGIAKVKEVTDQLSLRAQQQFLEAVRKLPEFRYIEAQWHSGNALHSVPDREDAKKVQSRALQENARQEFAAGEACEKVQQYGAALIHFRQAQTLDRAMSGIEERIALLERELKAATFVEQAQVSMRAQRFDEARTLLDAAFEWSHLSRGQVTDLRAQLRGMEGEKRFQDARDLEVLGRKAEALAAFEKLAADYPEGLRDLEARLAGLRVDVKGAGDEWAAAEAAEAAGDLEKALEHYRGAETYYAGWKDGKARIQRLEAAIAAKKAAETAGAGAQPEQP